MDSDSSSGPKNYPLWKTEQLPSLITKLIKWLNIYTVQENSGRYVHTSPARGTEKGHILIELPKSCNIKTKVDLSSFNTMKDLEKEEEFYIKKTLSVRKPTSKNAKAKSKQTKKVKERKVTRSTANSKTTKESVNVEVINNPLSIASQQTQPSSSGVYSDESPLLTIVTDSDDNNTNNKVESNYLHDLSISSDSSEENNQQAVKYFGANKPSLKEATDPLSLYTTADAIVGNRLIDLINFRPVKTQCRNRSGSLPSFDLHNSNISSLTRKKSTLILNDDKENTEPLPKEKSQWKNSLAESENSHLTPLELESQCHNEVEISSFECESLSFSLSDISISSLFDSKDINENLEKNVSGSEGNTEGISCSTEKSNEDLATGNSAEQLPNTSRYPLRSRMGTQANNAKKATKQNP